jgi:predicted transcriptional regulator
MTPTMPDQPSIFDGYYVTAADDGRLLNQLERIFYLMRDGQPRTVAQIHAIVGGTQTGVSARLRDLRKAKFGAYEIVTNDHGGGHFTYRLVDGHRPLIVDKDAARDRTPKLSDTVKTLLDKLNTYTRHDPSCRYWVPEPCKCGLAQLHNKMRELGVWS